MGSKPSTHTPDSEPTAKKSLYRRYEDAKNGRNKTVSDEDLQKHTGMTRSELTAWSQDRPGVAGNQKAGDITIGPASGIGGYHVGSGFGGWGPDANGGLKYPPEKSQPENKET